MDNIRTRIRSIAREQILDILGFFSRPSNGVHLLNGHILTHNEDLDASFFDDQLKVLTKQSTIIPFAEAVQILNSKKIINQSLIAFSFDDGFAECYTHIAPVLEKYNGHACFFICPNFIDGNEEYISTFLKHKVHQKIFKKPMNWQQIKELNNMGHIIGSHTMDHVRVSEIRDKADLHYQIGGCKQIIESYTNDKCDFFAFTYGNLGRDFNFNDVYVAKEYYSNVFSAFGWKKYFCCDGLVFNRRHAEPYWKADHINYFISKKLTF